MKVNSRFAGLVIATGDKTNYKQIDPLRTTGSISILQRMVDTLYSSGAYPIVMITGQDAWEVERYLAGAGVIFIRADDFMELTTLQLIQGGCAYLGDKHKMIVVASVEFPFFRAETVKQLTQSKCTAAVPAFKETPGYPIVLGSEIIQNIAEVETDESVLAYLKNQPELTVMETEDEGILCRPEISGVLPGALRQPGGRELHPYIRVDIGGEEQIFDPRLKMILFLIDETSSVKTASLHASLSLGLAWEMIGGLEQVLGYQVVKRYQDRFYGRADEDRAGLTDAGREFLTKYVKYERQLIRYANRTFEELFYEKEGE